MIIFIILLLIGLFAIVFDIFNGIKELYNNQNNRETRLFLNERYYIVVGTTTLDFKTLKVLIELNNKKFIFLKKDKKDKLILRLRCYYCKNDNDLILINLPNLKDFAKFFWYYLNINYSNLKKDENEDKNCEYILMEAQKEIDKLKQQSKEMIDSANQNIYNILNNIKKESEEEID